ncbi:polymer-forming cytoskeletal protein [Methanosalsum natronophilum]|nr:polymer-forming cytoskeletal protein [Methanosalsum natronophilum]MCS3923722.1 putative acyltransferase (DUF342 family) [Methanosalsum natronophilum]
MECEHITDHDDLLKTFIIPDNTSMEEHTIVVDGDVIIGNHSDIRYGLIANTAILGERVNVSGNLITTSDVRIDMWSRIGGNVKTHSDAYIGEFVTIDGKLVVKGDLDIGNDVKINGGFEAKGWIVIRNPIPVIAYLFMYLSEMLRLGKDEEVEKALEELFEEDIDTVDETNAMIVPNGSKISMDAIRVPSGAIIGDKCRLVGNIRATSIDVGTENTLYGSIRTLGDAVIGENNIIHGNIVSRGDVYVAQGTHVLGEINARYIKIHEHARVDGVLRSQKGTIFERENEDVLSDSELKDLEV